MRGPTIGIRRTARSSARVPFEKMAREIFPESYEVSLVLCGDSLSRRMNRTYRKKDYSPNVLSFPLNKNAGEIFLNLRKAEREARALRVSTQKRVALLFVHGSFHLLGMKHGEKMEERERQVLRKFGF